MCRLPQSEYFRLNQSQVDAIVYGMSFLREENQDATEGGSPELSEVE